MNSTRTWFNTDSLMLRPGYKVYLYEKKMWRGKYAVYEGKWASDDASQGKLQCQGITEDWWAKKKGSGSLRIMKEERGKVTGYWKGITSS